MSLVHVVVLFIRGLTLYDKSYELNWEVPEKLSCPNKSFTMTGSK